MKIIKFNNEEENLLNEMDYDLEAIKDPKWFQVFAIIAICFGVINISIAPLLALNVPTILAYLIATPIVGPLTFITVKKIKEKSDRDFKGGMQGVNQLMQLMVEVSEVDHKITENSVCFYNEINNDSTLKSLNAQAKTNINQFIYMINANYYHEIASKHPNLKREEVVSRLISQIAAFYQESGIHTFTKKEAKAIINNCFFIDEETKQKITKEFKKSEWKWKKEARYHIINNNLENKTFGEEEKRIKEELNSSDHYLKTFDINDPTCYSFLLECFTSIDEKLKEYGDVSRVSWDLFALRDIMSYMLTNFHREIAEIKGDFYNSTVVMDFMYNAFVYASINKTGKVSIEEIINTFKNWLYLDDCFNLKIKILDGIFEEFNLDYSLHPFHKNVKKKGDKSKTIAFPKKQI